VSPEPVDGPRTMDAASVRRELAAIASPTAAVLCAIVELWTTALPRTAIPPPAPPDVLPAIVERMILAVEPGWMLMPPPSDGAVLPVIAERSILVVDGPMLKIAPPAKLMASLPENVESCT
jgi:hypothetical protein